MSNTEVIAAYVPGGVRLMGKIGDHDRQKDIAIDRKRNREFSTECCTYRAAIPIHKRRWPDDLLTF